MGAPVRGTEGVVAPPDRLDRTGTAGTSARWRTGSAARRPAQPGARLFWTWIVIGLALRLLVLRSSWARTDADESAGILMAMTASQGHFFTFFWGANYGGTVVTVVEAALVRFFGTTLVLFRGVDLAISFVDVLLLRSVGRRAVGAGAGNVAAALFWVFPAAWVFWSSHEYVFWLPGCGCALGTALVCLRWRDDRRDDRLWPIGLLFGLTVWMYPLYLCVALPPVVAVLVTQRVRLTGILKTVALVPIGAAPWLYTNVTRSFESFHHPIAGNVGFTTGVHLAITEILPAALSATFTSVGVVWGMSVPAHRYLLLIAAVAMGGTLAWTVWSLVRRDAVRCCIGSTVLLWPLLVAGGRVPESVSAYRYGLVIVPSLLLILGDLAARVRLSVPLLVAGTAVTLIIGGAETSGWAAASIWQPGTTQVSRYLEAHHLAHVWAGYWESYPLTVLTDGTVQASSIAPIRDQREADAAAGEPRSTVVTLGGTPLDKELLAWVAAHHDAKRVVVGDYAVYRFDRRIDPSLMGLVSPI